MSKNVQIRIDELTKSLLNENHEMEPNCSYLFGFVGENKSEEHFTLYFDLMLKQSIVMKKEDVLHTVNFTKTHSPYGGTLIWFKNASQYLYGVTEEQIKQHQNVTDQYLQGNIYTQHMHQQQATPTGKSGEAKVATKTEEE